MSERLKPPQDFEIIPDKWDDFVMFLKVTGVRIPKKPLQNRVFRKTHDANTVLNLLNPLPLKEFGGNSTDSLEAVNNMDRQNEFRFYLYQSEQVRQQISQFIRQKVTDAKSD